MFFKRYTKLRAGDTLKIEYLNETANKIEFLDEVKKDLLLKAKAILRHKNINCNNVNNFKQLADEINNYQYKKNTRRPRFNGNVIDLRDTIKDGEILLMVKAGATVKFALNTYLNQKFIVEWEENGKAYKSVLNSGATFSKTAPSTGISSEDGSFKYTIYKITSPGVIREFFLPWGAAGNNVSWFVSKNIKFDSIYFNASDYMSGDWGMQNLEYVDILDGGTHFIRANGCVNLKEIEADYIYLKEIKNGKMIFCDCKKLVKLPDNSVFKCHTFENAFRNCTSLVELPYIDMSFSYNNARAFMGCTSLLRFRDNTLKVNKNASCDDICNGCTSLLEIPNIIYADDELSKGGSFNNAFNGCIAATKMSPSLNLSYCRYGARNMFYNCNSIIDGPSEILLYDDVNDTNASYSLDSMFEACSSLRSIIGLITSSNVESCSSMFKDCISLKRAPRCVFPNTIACSEMYRNCNTLITPPDSIDYPKALGSTYMFSKCALLQSAPKVINLPNTSSVTYMFENCSSMITGPTTINIETSTNNTNMFIGCSSLENFGELGTVVILNIAADNTNMFRDCVNLKTICDFKGGYKFDAMFYNAGLERHPGFNTSSVCTFHQTFYGNPLTSIEFNRIIAPNVYSFTNTFELSEASGNLIADFKTMYPRCVTWDFTFKGCKFESVNITFSESTRYISELFSNCYDLKQATINIPADAFINNIFIGTRLLNTININGDFTFCNQFSNFTSTWLKTLSLNTPKWRNWNDNNWRLDKFTTLESCNLTVDIHLFTMIRNNKKLTDINLNLIHDGFIKSNIVIYMDGNAFNADTLNKIMTNLPDINSMEKLDETYTAEIRIGNNPGTATCDVSIASDKGWLVYTS